MRIITCTCSDNTNEHYTAYVFRILAGRKWETHLVVELSVAAHTEWHLSTSSRGGVRREGRGSHLLPIRESNTGGCGGTVRQEGEVPPAVCAVLGSCKEKWRGSTTVAAGQWHTAQEGGSLVGEGREEGTGWGEGAYFVSGWKTDDALSLPGSGQWIETK